MKTHLISEKQGRLGVSLKRMKHLIATPVALAMVILATSCASDRHERSAGESIDDQATSRRVQNALSGDSAYKYTEVKVATYQGVVQLSGFVDKGEQKDHAEDVAKRTEGAKEVKNNIVVRK